MTESISSGLLVQGMRPEAARRQVEIFRQRFKEPHFYFAQHAAFPLALTPDLLYRLWANFQRNIHGEKLKIPWLAVADLLLSPLCEEVDVGYELYEMDVTVRALLLDDLQVNPRFSKRRIDELSSFLQDYAQQQLKSSDPTLLDTARGQRWTALAYMRPEEVTREMAEALTVLHKNNGMEQMRIVSLMETLGALAEPLAVFEGFAPLLTYAQEITNFAKEDKEITQTQKSFAKETELVERVLGIRLPTLEQLQQARDTRTDFCISYHHTDQDWSHWIGWQLEEAGYDIVLQEWSFRSDSDFGQEIDAILQIAKHIIVILSPDYLKKFTNMADWGSALLQDARTNNERRIFMAVQVRECVEELKSLLGDFVYKDFVDKSEQEARDALLRDVDFISDTNRDVSVAMPSVVFTSRIIAEKPLFPSLKDKFSENSSTSSVFLSYAQADSEFVARLKADLHTYGITIWVDASMIETDNDWDKAIRTAQVVLFIASPASRSSMVVHRELALAQRYGRPIYPIWIAGKSWVDVAPLSMVGMMYIDARDVRYQIALSEIVVAFEKIGISVTYPSSDTEGVGLPISRSSIFIEHKNKDNEFSPKRTQDLPRVIGLTNVYFIRNGESEADAGQPTAYPFSIKLTPKGIEQAYSIASFLKDEPDLIITSPYKYASQTAQPILSRFPHTPHEEWPVEEFTYLAPHDTLTTTIERRPMVEAFWQRDDPSYADGDEVESFIAFIFRVQNVMKHLRRTKANNIVVFSHEQFIDAILWLFLKGKLESDSTLSSDSMRQFRDFLAMTRIPNGAIMLVVLNGDKEIWISPIITSHLSP